MRAKLLPLAIAREEFPEIVVDTNILIDAYGAQQRGIAPRTPLPMNARLIVCVVTLYELFRGTKGALLGREQRALRRDWLAERRIGRLATGKAAATTGALDGSVIGDGAARADSGPAGFDADGSSIDAGAPPVARAGCACRARGRPHDDPLDRAIALGLPLAVAIALRVRRCRDRSGRKTRARPR